MIASDPRPSPRQREVLAILSKASTDETPVRIRDIGRQLGLTESTIHHHLRVLESLQMAERDRSGHWWACSGFVSRTDKIVGLIRDALNRIDHLIDEESRRMLIEAEILVKEGRK